MCLLPESPVVTHDYLVPISNHKGWHMSLSGKSVLIFGSDGAQGSGLAPALLESGAVPIRAPRRPERAGQWRAAGGASVVADLTDAGAVVAAAKESEAFAVAGHLPLALGP